MISAKRLTIPEGAVGSISSDGNVIWTTDALPITTKGTLIKYTGAELHERLNLTPSSHNGVTNEEYFTFKLIPVEPGAKYYALHGTRSWFLKEDKTAQKTMNLRTANNTGSSVPYECVVPADARYLSISYNYATINDPGAVIIQKIQ